MDTDILARVCGSTFQHGKAKLAGFLRRQVSGEVYPAITRHPQGQVDGIVYFHVSLAAFQCLDRFESDLYNRIRVNVVRDDGKRLCADTYIIAPEQAHRLSTNDWNYEEFLQQHKRLF